jgi:hypothetical protein
MSKTFKFYIIHNGYNLTVFVKILNLRLIWFGCVSNTTRENYICIMIFKNSVSPHTHYMEYDI